MLAGGRSRRFGREKALALLGGRPLIAWTARVLEAGTARVAVSARPGSGAAAYAAQNGLDGLADGQDMEEGPLAGVLEGLRWAQARGAERLVTAPCDAPFLPQDLVVRLAAASTAGGAVAVTDEGLQPLCALWPVGAVARLEGRAGHPPVRTVLAELGAAEARFPETQAFFNVNTPEALARAEARLAGREDELEPSSAGSA